MTERERVLEAIDKEIYLNGPNCSLNSIDVSRVEDFSRFFFESDFNGDISGWDVGNATNMWDMFMGSSFNGDISKWNTANVRDMCGLFYESEFNQDISKWDVSHVKDMSYMFFESEFNQDISGWNIRSDCYVYKMFTGSWKSYENLSSLFNKYPRLEKRINIVYNKIYIEYI